MASQPLEANVTYCFKWVSWSPQEFGTEITLKYHDLVTLEFGEICNAWTCLWEGQGGDDHHWEQHHVPLQHHNPFNVYFYGSIEGHVTVPLSVDDFHLEKGSCPPDPDDTFQCTDGSTVPAQNVCDMKNDCRDSSIGSDELNCGACTFEDSECGWENEVSTDFFWYRQDGSQPCQDLDCSGGDHTFVNDNQTSGHFIYLQHQDQEPNGMPAYMGPGINDVFSSCMFKFW